MNIYNPLETLMLIPRPDQYKTIKFPYRVEETLLETRFFSFYFNGYVLSTLIAHKHPLLMHIMIEQAAYEWRYKYLGYLRHTPAMNWCLLYSIQFIQDFTNLEGVEPYDYEMEPIGAIQGDQYLNHFYEHIDANLFSELLQNFVDPINISCALYEAPETLANAMDACLPHYDHFIIVTLHSGYNVERVEATQDTTIYELKQRASQLFNIPFNFIRLKTIAYECFDDYTLRHYNISLEFTLYVIIRGLGGMYQRDEDDETTTTTMSELSVHDLTDDEQEIETVNPIINLPMNNNSNFGDIEQCNSNITISDASSSASGDSFFRQRAKQNIKHVDNVSVNTANLSVYELTQEDVDTEINFNAWSTTNTSSVSSDIDLDLPVDTNIYYALDTDTKNNMSLTQTQYIDSNKITNDKFHESFTNVLMSIVRTAGYFNILFIVLNFILLFVTPLWVVTLFICPFYFYGFMVIALLTIHYFDVSNIIMLEQKIIKSNILFKFTFQLLFGCLIQQLLQPGQLADLVVKRSDILLLDRNENLNTFDEFTELINNLKEVNSQGVFTNVNNTYTVNCSATSDIITDKSFWTSHGHVSHSKMVSSKDVLIQTNYYGDTPILLHDQVIFVAFRPLKLNYASDAENWTFNGKQINRKLNFEDIYTTDVIFNDLFSINRQFTWYNRWKLFKTIYKYNYKQWFFMLQWVFGIRSIVDTFTVDSQRSGNFVVSKLTKIRSAHDYQLNSDQKYLPVFKEQQITTHDCVWGYQDGGSFHFGLINGHQSYSVTTALYDAAVSQIRADPKLSNSSLSRLMEQYGIELNESSRLLYYFKTIINARGSFVADYHAYTVHSTKSFFEPADDFKCGVRVLFPPVVNATAAVPSDSVYNDINTLHGRILKVNKKKTHFPDIYKQYANEFARLIVPDDKAKTGLIISDSEYIDTLDTEVKRLRYNRYKDYALIRFKHIVEAFQKGEAYPSVGNPRNISAVNAGVLLNLAKFTISFKKNILSNFPWYCPTLTPKQIAEKVRDLCQVDNVVETDMSRYDGTISYWLRVFIEHKCYSRYFKYEFQDELNNYFVDELCGIGITKHQLLYETMGTRLSGSPFTTDGNTLINAFMFFVAQRDLGFTLEQIQDEWNGRNRLQFLAYGDDGLCNLDGETVARVATELGLSLKIIERDPSVFVGFLGRFFIIPRHSIDSIQDPNRILTKIHLSFSNPNIPLDVAIINKLRSFSYTDKHSPIIRSIVKLVERTYNIKLNSLDEKWRLLIERYHRELARDNRYFFSDECECWPQTDDLNPKLDVVSTSLRVNIEEVLAYERYIDSLKTLSDIKDVLQMRDVEIKVTASVNGTMHVTETQMVDTVRSMSSVSIVSPSVVMSNTKNEISEINQIVNTVLNNDVSTNTSFTSNASKNSYHTIFKFYVQLPKHDLLDYINGAVSTSDASKLLGVGFVWGDLTMDEISDIVIKHREDKLSGNTYVANVNLKIMKTVIGNAQKRYDEYVAMDDIKTNRIIQKNIKNMRRIQNNKANVHSKTHNRSDTSSNSSKNSNSTNNSNVNKIVDKTQFQNIKFSEETCEIDKPCSVKSTDNINAIRINNSHTPFKQYQWREKANKTNNNNNKFNKNNNNNNFNNKNNNNNNNNKFNTNKPNANTNRNGGSGNSPTVL